MDELKKLLESIDGMAEKCKILDLPGNPFADEYNQGVETFALWVKQRINMMLMEGGEQ